LKIYIDLKQKNKPAIFESGTEPQKENHPQYDVINGATNQKKMKICQRHWQARKGRGQNPFTMVRLDD